MADVHVMETSGGRTRLVLHVSIPAANNAAGVAYRTAVVNSKLGGTTSLPDGDGTAGTISAAEKASIASGALYEATVSIKRADLTVQGLNALFAKQAPEIRGELQGRLASFGGTV
jgi:hypothetical protein